jgi:hypothetical protein
VRLGFTACAAAAFFLSTGAPAWGQFSTDARVVGMGGLQLHRGSALDRYNPAYRAVPPRADGGGSAKVTIPIPLGLIPFLQDHPPGDWGNDPLFDFSDPAFNPVELLNLVLHPPLFLEVKKIPTPTNDFEFTIGKNELIVDLGLAQSLIPADQFGLGSSSRLADFGFGLKGARVGVIGWLHHEVGLTLGDTLLAFLKDADPALPNTRYNMLADITVQTGIAPYVGWAGRLAGTEDRGLFIGATLRYYMGAAYGRTLGDAGFITGDTIFSTVNPLTPDITANTAYSKWGNSIGKGVGGDVGLVLVTGPLELGVGVSDIGAKLTWKETRIERAVYDTMTDEFSTTLISAATETTTELPVAYLFNVAYSIGDAAFGANVQNGGRGTTLHVGAEKRFGPLALRGGVSRDQRKKMQLGWGGGLRFGAVSLDVGFWTYSEALSDARGITMATSLSLY